MFILQNMYIRHVVMYLGTKDVDVDIPSYIYIDVPNMETSLGTRPLYVD